MLAILGTGFFTKKLLLVINFIGTFPLTSHRGVLIVVPHLPFLLPLRTPNIFCSLVHQSWKSGATHSPSTYHHASHTLLTRNILLSSTSALILIAPLMNFFLNYPCSKYLPAFNMLSGQPTSVTFFTILPLILLKSSTLFIVHSSTLPPNCRLIHLFEFPHIHLSFLPLPLFR